MRSAVKRTGVLDRFIKYQCDIWKYAENAFEFEEGFIFPAILSKCATADCTKLISQLRSEHAMILRELHEFRKVFHQSVNPGGREMDLRLEELAKNILASLYRHAAKEDDELLPILRKNGHILGA